MKIVCYNSKSWFTLFIVIFQNNDQRIFRTRFYYRILVEAYTSPRNRSFFCKRNKLTTSPFTRHKIFPLRNSIRYGVKLYFKSTFGFETGDVNVKIQTIERVCTDIVWTTMMSNDEIVVMAVVTVIVSTARIEIVLEVSIIVIINRTCLH